MKTTIGQTVSFGRDGDAQPIQLYGWSGPENGFTWTVGPESGLLLQTPPARYGFYLEIALTPYVVRNRHPVQRLAVKINGHAVGEVWLSGHGTFAFYVPPQATGWDRMVVTLEHPDARRPVDLGTSGDTRAIAVSINSLRILMLDTPLPTMHQRTSHVPLSMSSETGEQAALDGAEKMLGISPAELVARFQSLGDNCEFGLFQRNCGAEPLGLLRFSTTFLQPLLRGLDSGFEGIGNERFVDPQLDTNGQGEWIVFERQYDLRYHTFVWQHQASREQVQKQESAKLTFLRRKLMEDVVDAAKIFVYKRAERAIPLAEIMPVFLALRRHGNNSLLWVVPADTDHPPGTVEELIPGLLRGYIDQFAPPEMVPKLSLPGWLAICINTWMLQREKVAVPV